MSPLTYARQMRTPLLLIHNEGDLRCPIEQAEQLFVQLRRIGKVETDLIRFPEESHNLSRSGRPDRRVERLERIVGWFDRLPLAFRACACGPRLQQLDRRFTVEHAATALPATIDQQVLASNARRSAKPLDRRVQFVDLQRSVPATGLAADRQPA